MEDSVLGMEGGIICVITNIRKLFRCRIARTFAIEMRKRREHEFVAFLSGFVQPLTSVVWGASGQPVFHTNIVGVSNGGTLKWKLNSAYTRFKGLRMCKKYE